MRKDRGPCRKTSAGSGRCWTRAGHLYGRNTRPIYLSVRHACPCPPPNGVAIGGCDPATYFNDGKPVKGSPGLKIDQQGVAYRFSTPESRDRFQKDPTASAPQRGSYSVFGMARRKRYDFDPKPWDIIDCKFYLSQNKKPGRCRRETRPDISTAPIKLARSPRRIAGPKKQPPSSCARRVTSG